MDDNDNIEVKYGDTYARNLLLSSGVPIDLSDQPVIPTESGDVFEVQGDEWGRNLLLDSGKESTFSDSINTTDEGEFEVTERFTLKKYAGFRWRDLL